MKSLIEQETKRKESLKKQIDGLDTQIKTKIGEFRSKREDRHCYPFLIGDLSIASTVVDDVYDDLRKDHGSCDGKLDVIIDSSSGDLNAAYNLALLLRKFAQNELIFFVPRWAKSAATLMVCSGDKIMMTPVAELGPLDPQITQVNPLEKRLEEFSPLYIEATLNLIREEFENGHAKLAEGLMKRLQFPLTLGGFRKSLDVAEEYLRRLLSSRMLNSPDDKGKTESIAKALTEGYVDHGFCINIDEAVSLGLKAEEMQGEILDIVWDIHKLNRQKQEFKAQQQKKETESILKDLPQDILGKAPSIELGEPDNGRSNDKHKIS